MTKKKDSKSLVLYVHYIGVSQVSQAFIFFWLFFLAILSLGSTAYKTNAEKNSKDITPPGKAFVGLEQVLPE